VAIECAVVQAVRKPWGSTDLAPWSNLEASGSAIGELWFHRADETAPPPALLLKLLFTSAPLSIQVHPDDAFAHSIDLPNGKTEAWYILSANADACVALGLKQPISRQELRASIRDGSIEDRVQWRPVLKGDTIFVPAGTIHALGAGLVLAEVQQRSDSTFRLFDYGRARELHEDNAVAVSVPGPIEAQPDARRLTAARTVLVENEHFVLERIDLPINSNWMLHADQETWMLVLEGHARIGAADRFAGAVIFADADCARIAVGPEGFGGLVAYPGPNPRAALLQDISEHTNAFADTSAAQPPPRTEILETQT
jgi:mannose-6-phosphate isomerase